ncbi:predicted protein [Naegleria gruberi]|uniref:Predicted protein n=1 Tax=Naegleria gruberi TaxID=5762 RepID=D2W2W0_NAEGR|nr:uncharacterized protein NAEGRDRAFT_75731 [Naegleria gruberi]EFC36585.1 predicted protein [Naegleria gruberi]|eukprot:XP_002669329.1 predicted protein [Naegleria gruberi strain NEG-M]
MGQSQNQSLSSLDNKSKNINTLPQPQHDEGSSIVDLSSVAQLPDEVLEQVLFFLDHKSLMRLRVSCKSFSEKIVYRKIIDTNKILKPTHDNQDDLYHYESLQISDMANVIGFHVSVLSHDQGWASVSI